MVFLTVNFVVESCELTVFALPRNVGNHCHNDEQEDDARKNPRNHNDAVGIFDFAFILFELCLVLFYLFLTLVDAFLLLLKLLGRPVKLILFFIDLRCKLLEPNVVSRKLTFENLSVFQKAVGDMLLPFDFSFLVFEVNFCNKNVLLFDVVLNLLLKEVIFLILEVAFLEHEHVFTFLQLLVLIFHKVEEVDFGAALRKHLVRNIDAHRRRLAAIDLKLVCTAFEQEVNHEILLEILVAGCI